MRTSTAIFLYALFTSLLNGRALTAAEAPAQPAAAADTIAVNIRVDAAATKGELRPVWRFFGADEPNYATMKDGKRLLGELGQLAPKQIYFRTHNLLTSGDGTPALKWGSTGVYAEDSQGSPTYDWTILDGIFDAYLQRGVRPYVEIGFMPKDLSVKPDPYQHRWHPRASYNEIFTGWSYPPKDYAKWGELVHQWAKHCAARYGTAETEAWYWQVWNEANLGYWRGTPEQFLRLHDVAIDAVRRAIPKARVGGPDNAGGGDRFLRDFLKHSLRETNFATGKIGTPLDFIAFHAKGNPTFVNGRVRMGIANQLQAVNSGFAAVASFPELRRTPIIIGESDPDGCAACQGPQLGYRNGTMYSSYTAASFAREYELADKHGVNFEGALTWAFEFEDQPYFAGFRVLSSNGIDLPVLNVFRMLSRMSGQRLAVTSDHAIGLKAIVAKGVRDEPDISAMASLDNRAIYILVWHYHDDDVAGPTANVAMTLDGLTLHDGDARLEHFRIDSDHSNSLSAWRRMGSPQKPDAAQYAELEKAGRLQMLDSPETIRVANGQAALRFALPRQAVSLLVIRWGK